MCFYFLFGGLVHGLKLFLTELLNILFLAEFRFFFALTNINNFLKFCSYDVLRKFMISIGNQRKGVLMKIVQDREYC